MEKQIYQLERTVLIGAAPETVFRFFTDSTRWAKWWGAGSSIDARVAGRVRIRQPGGVEAVGDVVEIVAGERIMFTYGYASGNPIPPGGSTVTMWLEPVEGGTELHLTHEFQEAEPREQHVQGWRFQLSLFANAVADEVHADAAGIADAWFEAWGVTDDIAREAAFAAIALPRIHFHDRFSALETVAELSAHAGAAQRFMQGVKMHRDGEIRQCQGTVLADWTARGADGQVAMRGVNVFVLGPDGRINSATGFAV